MKRANYQILLFLDKFFRVCGSLLYSSWALCGVIPPTPKNGRKNPINYIYIFELTIQHCRRNNLTSPTRKKPLPIWFQKEYLNCECIFTTKRNHNQLNYHKSQHYALYIDFSKRPLVNCCYWGIQQGLFAGTNGQRYYIDTRKDKDITCPKGRTRKFFLSFI